MIWRELARLTDGEIDVVQMSEGLEMHMDQLEVELKSRLPLEMHDRIKVRKYHQVKKKLMSPEYANALVFSSPELQSWRLLQRASGTRVYVPSNFHLKSAIVYAVRNMVNMDARLAEIDAAIRAESHRIPNSESKRKLEQKKERLAWLRLELDRQARFLQSVHIQTAALKTWAGDPAATALIARMTFPISINNIFLLHPEARPPEASPSLPLPEPTRPHGWRFFHLKIGSISFGRQRKQPQVDKHVAQAS